MATEQPIAIQWRLRIANAIAATAFLIGGTLFAIGAALAQAGVEATVCASVYLVGGVFFSTGGYTSVLQVANEPGGPAAAGGDARWRWWSREPQRLQWLSAVVLFSGTLVFAINLVDSFIEGLSPAAENRLVWSPDMVGCALFLVSGHLALVEIGGGRRFWRHRDLGWWIVGVNQIGSVLFMASAVASFVEPASAEAVNAGIANWGTLAGALCFAFAGLMQEFEHPLGPRRRRDSPATTAPARPG
jgi:hypothetical protein